MAEDVENNVDVPVAPVNDIAQNEQEVSSETETNSPYAPADNEDLILGKFKSQDDLIKSYQELERQNTRTRQMEPQGYSPYPPQYYPPVQPAYESAPAFDADTERGLSQFLDRELSKKLEERKAMEFAQKHAKELEDPILDGAVRRIIQDANSKNLRLDQEDALRQAKELLEKRLGPQVKKAEAQGFEEGQEIARKKAQAGAVGEVSAKSPVKGDDELSSAEFAAKYNLARRA